ncbi:MAG: universal stress protein [Xanthobacteraceae bacterium]
MISNLKNMLLALANATGEPEASSVAAYGLSLASQSGARLAVHSSSIRLALPHSLVSDLASGLVSTENARLKTLAETAAQDARAAASLAGVACTTQTPHLPYDQLVADLVAQARIHDLTVLDAAPSSVATDRGLIEAVLFDSGRPVLVVPAGIAEFRGRRIAVAWDGSARAARALNDALPLLRAAEQVEIVSIQGEKDLSNAVPGVEVAPHLASHGITATVVDLTVEHNDVAQTLRTYALQHRVDLIVMGAFVHSWLRQLILGGVTRSLLKASPVPLFLSY